MYATINRINKSIQAAIDYILLEKDATPVFSNIYPDDAKRSLDRFEIVDFYTEKMKQNGKSSLATGFITYGGNKTVSSEIMGEMVGMFLIQSGILDSQYVVGSHNNTSMEHCHFITTDFFKCFCFNDYLTNEEEEELEKNSKLEFVAKENLNKDSAEKKIRTKEMSVKQFSIIYRKTSEQRKKMFIKSASAIEGHYGLEKNSVKVYIGKDRYIENRYSIKYHLNYAFELAIALSISFKEFFKNLKPAIEKVFRSFAKMLEAEKRSKLLLKVNKFIETFEVGKSSSKNSKQDLIIRSSVLNIKGGTLNPALYIKKIWERFQKIINPVSSDKGDNQLRLYHFMGILKKSSSTERSESIKNELINEKNKINNANDSEDVANINQSGILEWLRRLRLMEFLMQIKEEINKTFTGKINSEVDHQIETEKQTTEKLNPSNEPKDTELSLQNMTLHLSLYFPQKEHLNLIARYAREEEQRKIMIKDRDRNTENGSNKGMKR